MIDLNIENVPIPGPIKERAFTFGSHGPIFMQVNGICALVNLKGLRLEYR